MKAGGDKNVLNRPVGPDNMRDWSFGLCDYFPRCRLCKKKPAQPTHFAWLMTLSSGLWATFCPCIIYGQNKQRLRYLQKRGRPLPGGGDTFSQDCRVYCCMAVPCFYWAFQVCGDSDQIHVDLSYAAFRWAAAQTSAIAMISAERASEIASTPCFVARVLLHRNAGSSSWRREVFSKGYRFLLRTY
jgi:hypothetical protein